MKIFLSILIVLGAIAMIASFPRHETLALCWYAIFLCSALLMHLGTNAWNIRKPTIASIWYFTFLIMIYFPALVVALDKQNAWSSTFLWGVALAVIAVPLGIICANALAHFAPAEIQRYFVEPTIHSHPSRIGAWIVVGIVCATTAIVAYYLMSLHTIPLVYMITHPGDAATLITLREESFKLFDPRWQGEQSSYLFYILLFLRTLIFPILITALVGYALVTKKLFWIVVSLFTFLLGGFYAASSIARAPLAAIFMRLFFFIYFFKNARLPKWLIACFLLLIISFPIAVTSMSHGAGSALTIGETTVSLARRFTVTPAEDLYYYFEIFPDYYPFLNGETLVKPFLKLFDKEYFYIENFVYKHISPLSPYETGHANAAFISNLYADFALPGVLIGSFLVGILMQLLQIYIFRQPKTVLSITLFSFCIYAIWALNFGSVTSVLFVNGILPVLILYSLTAKFFYSSLHIY